MTRRAKFLGALVLLAMCAGLGVWTWYLSGRTPEEADQASSVLGGVRRRRVRRGRRRG